MKKEYGNPYIEQDHAKIILMSDTNEKNESAKLRLALAMKKQMQDKSIENITVRDIAQEAGLSRQTFYRCFLDKYDLVNWYFDRLLNESFERMGSGETIREGLIRKFSYIKEEYVFFRTAFSNDSQNNLRDHDFEMIFAFYKNLIQIKNSSAVAERIYDVLEMYCSASIYMTVKWVMNDLPKTPEELADLMIDAMPAILAELFRKLNVLI